MPSAVQRSIFTQKHYEWLATWAARNLPWTKINILIEDLTNENAKFNPITFGEWVLKHKINS